MITLFNINKHTINTGSFDNLLHGEIVTEFEGAFCKYVGAKYGCSVNSATNALYLCLMMGRKGTVKIPSMIPPVVLNSILHSGNQIEFCDNISWVGHSYLFHSFPGFNIIDSAQQVDRNQFKEQAKPSDLMVFSFYPTKPVGSCDGAMVVSDDKARIEYLRVMTMNGMSKSNNSWEREVEFPGWKMYMNSIQAKIAFDNLKKLDEKKAILKKIRAYYNSKFGLTHTSDHLYRVYVFPDNDTLIKKLRGQHKIICGKHYSAAHLSPVYNKGKANCPLSEMISKVTLSIPFHEKLNMNDADRVVRAIKYEVI